MFASYVIILTSQPGNRLSFQLVILSTEDTSYAVNIYRTLDYSRVHNTRNPCKQLALVSDLIFFQLLLLFTNLYLGIILVMQYPWRSPCLLQLHRQIFQGCLFQDPKIIKMQLCILRRTFLSTFLTTFYENVFSLPSHFSCINSSSRKTDEIKLFTSLFNMK